MAEKIVQALRMPRLVTGIMRRCRDPETIAVMEAIPVALRRAERAEAPVAFTRHNRLGATPCREFDGEAYAQVGHGQGSPEASWEAMLGQVVPHVMDDLGMIPVAQHSKLTGLLGWTAALAGASRKRGIMGGTDGFKEIHADGTAARDRDVARLADRLLVVGDELWFRVEAPRILVSPYHGLIEGDERAALLSWGQNARLGAPWTAGSFRIDRREEAVEFADRLGTALGLTAAWTEQERLEVVDADAVDAIYRALGTDEILALQGVAGSIGIALKHDLGTLPEEEILRYADLLRHLRNGAADDVHAWMDANLDPMRAAVATARAISKEKDQAAPGESPLAQIDMAITRYRECEAPRRHLAAGDEAALLAL